MQSQNDFAAELKFLAENGFTKERKNLRLLTKTNGNVDVVVNFLKAQVALHDSLVATKKSLKETKEALKSFENLNFGESEPRNKDAKKELKRDRKESKKADKKRSHADRDLQKQAKKEEKRLKKEERKTQKEAKKTAKAEEDAPLKSLPENIKNVWLDGNNMLFVTSAIRNTCLRTKLRNGEKLLEAMARQWTNNSSQIAKCTLIFDDTPTHLSEPRFEVLSARPHYPTSDHALIDWATKADVDEKAAICVFTSDRALGESLRNAGVTVLKSKKWYQLAASTLPMEGAEGVDDWADKWIAANNL